MEKIMIKLPLTTANISILIAEDNMGNGRNSQQTILAQALTRLGHSIKTTDSSHTAQKLSLLCTLHQPEFLIVHTESLTTELLTEIIFIDQLSPLPVLIISKQTLSASISQSIANRSAAYVINSIAIEQLPDYITTTIQQFNARQTRRNDLEQRKKQLRDRKVIIEATGYLMAQRQVSEDSALKLLKQMAIKNSQSLTITANNVVSVCSLLKQHCG